MDLSDHFPIFALFGHKNPKLVSKEVSFRQFSDTNLNSFKHKMSLIDWSALYESVNTNDAFHIFSTHFSDLYQKCFPMKKKHVKYFHDENRPWLTAAIITSCRTKNKLYYRYTRNPTPNNLQRYKDYKRLLASLLKQAEKNHYRTAFQSASGNIKATWNVINNILKRKKSYSQLPNEFLIEGVKTTNKLDIANKFNEFFSQIGDKLSSKISPSNKSTLEYLNNLPRIQYELQFSEPKYEELLQILSCLENKSASLDEVKPSVVKFSQLEVIQPLLFIYKKAFEEGCFPEDLKHAKVIPLFKAGNDDNFSNYRPISILSVFSKLLEKHAHSRLYDFLDYH